VPVLPSHPSSPERAGAGASKKKKKKKGGGGAKQDDAEIAERLQRWGAQHSHMVRFGYFTGQRNTGGNGPQFQGTPLPKQFQGTPPLGGATLPTKLAAGLSPASGSSVHSAGGRVSHRYTRATSARDAPQGCSPQSGRGSILPKGAL
jgi:hypothetical protein